MSCSDKHNPFSAAAILPDGRGGVVPCPELLTEAELIRFLRIPEVSTASNHANVIDDPRRCHGLPCIIYD